MENSAFGASWSFTSLLTAHRRIATIGDALVLTTGPRTVFGQAPARQIGGVANVSSQEVTTKSTAPSTSCAALVVREVPLGSSKPTTARTPHQRRRATTPAPISTTSSTLKHSRESGC